MGLGVFIAQVRHHEAGAMTQHHRHDRIASHAKAHATLADLAVHGQRLQDVSIFPELAVEAELPFHFIAGPLLETGLEKLAGGHQLTDWLGERGDGGGLDRGARSHRRTFSLPAGAMTPGKPERTL